MKKISLVWLLALIAIITANAQSVDTLKIQSKVFNSTRKVKVYLPAGYNSEPGTKYLVAYLFDSQAEDFFNFYKSTINYLTKQGYMKPVILVGIASDNRQYEFTPKAETPQGLKYFRKSGGAELLAQHLKDEVLPLIKEKYRCENYNIGIGHSLGATFVTYCLLKFPELFNATIAISPNYQYDNLQLVHKFDSLPNPSILNHKFLYIAHGNGDTNEDNFKIGSNKIDSILLKRNFPGLRWQFKSMDNDSHGTTAMEGIFKGLIALYREFTMPDKQFSALYKNTNNTLVADLKSYYQPATAWAGFQLPIVDDINAMGYNCFYDGKKKEAIDVFIWGLTLYPDNINLYDSMGEMQQSVGNKSEALNYYTKGMQLVKQLKDKFDDKSYNNKINGFEKRIKSLDK